MTTTQENLSETKKHDEVVIPKEAAQKRLKAISNWSLQENTLVREFVFKDFIHAMNFVQDVGDVAELENHHPDIYISYNKVKLTLTTHKVGGLTTKDFALAYKVNVLFENRT